MKRSKIFVGIILLVSLLLGVMDLPWPYTLTFKTPQIPFLAKSQADQKQISIPIVHPYKLGLDLQGGVRLTYDLEMKNTQDTSKQSLVDATRAVVERRINPVGVTEPLIQTLRVGNNYRMIVELPGLTDANQAVARIGKTAELTFWEETTENMTPTEATSSAYPNGAYFLMGGKKPKKTALTGRDLKSATVGFNSANGTAEVQLRFSSNGAKLFADITRRNLGKHVLISLDNDALQAPVVQSEIPNGQASITGGYTVEQAKLIADILTGGALPVPMKLVAQSNVGPSLGIESLKKSLFAGILGLLSIVIFMIYIYRKEGSLACLALLVYTLIVLFIFKTMPVTLTLAGIAGFILSIGMAVDANILIFERMKEEKRLGKNQVQVVEQGFRRAWTSIRDSNISSIITATILFYFGTGTVRGFALTLLIGVLVSMFSAITVTRNFLRVFDRKEVSKK
jgi:preprotein translocase subunit SecD